ncbi:MAG: hypothetical protein AB7S50_04390 [Bacteroidales bacterium]
MEKNKVPQDEGITAGITREVQYAIDENGKYIKTFSKGWEPKNIVNSIAWDLINERVEMADEKIRKGKASPILHFMEKHQMNISILADYTEIPRIKVWWHLKPKGFKNIKDEYLKAYSQVFEVSIEEIIQFNPTK